MSDTQEMDWQEKLALAKRNVYFIYLMICAVESSIATGEDIKPEDVKIFVKQFELGSVKSLVENISADEAEELATLYGTQLVDLLRNVYESTQVYEDLTMESLKEIGQRLGLS